MIFEKVCALIAEQFNVDADSITMDTSFEDDLNADSVDIVDRPWHWRRNLILTN